MAKISAVTLSGFLPDFLAESVRCGTDRLIPAGLPLDLTSIPVVDGKQDIQAGAIVNRLWSLQATGKFKLWTGTGTPDALEEFFIVPFAVEDLAGLAKDKTGEAACNGLRWGTLIYEDRLPDYYQALSAALRVPIRDKYQMIVSRKVAL